MCCKANVETWLWRPKSPSFPASSPPLLSGTLTCLPHQQSYKETQVRIHANFEQAVVAQQSINTTLTCSLLPGSPTVSHCLIPVWQRTNLLPELLNFYPCCLAEMQNLKSCIGFHGFCSSLLSFW